MTPLEKILDSYRDIVRGVLDARWDDVARGLRELPAEELIADAEWKDAIESLRYTVEDCMNGVANVRKENVADEYNALVFRYAQTKKPER
jgi:hypothetical protein